MLRHFAGHEREKYWDVFGKMFQQRKIVFHDQKKWDVQVVDGKYEIDPFDRDDTSYLMSFDRGGELVGSVRLISTVTPHMLSGPFRSMFPDLQFTSPVIWEATRFVVLGDRSAQPNQVSTAACEILLGMCQFGLEYGVRHITAVYDAGMARLYRRCGLTHLEIGRHRTAEHGMVFAGLWEISESLEEAILAATGLGDAGDQRQTPRAA
jgi:N-acyl-L-homoserine lactone synthetase